MNQKRAITLLSILLTALFASSSALSQDTCDALVQRALAAMSENCERLDRNTACYGFDSIEATFVEDVAVEFTAPADTAEVATLQTIHTAAFNEETEEWGVALMNVQAANIAGTLPGQSLVFVLMGDTQLTTADGEIDPEAPMQAFYLTTGLGTQGCQQAPDSLVIQSPENVRVNLTINEAEIELGSTAILSLVDDGTAFEITMAHGEAIIDGETVVPEGHWAKMPLNMDAPLDDDVFAVSGEEPFCRPVPEDQLVNFQTMMDNMPESVMHYTVDPIETHPDGCQTLSGE